jgi:RNA polymerase sigma factor (sigma-70 family)
VAIPPDEAPEKVAAAEALGFLFDQALRGDGEALGHFFKLIYAEQETFIRRMEMLKTDAHTGTLHEVFQNTVMDLMAGLEAGKVPNLDEEDRKDLLKYFQRRCDGRLRDYVRHRVSPALSRHKLPLDEQTPDPNARIPGEQRDTEHIALLNDAAEILSPENYAILRMYREGKSHQEMAKITGKKEETLRSAMTRISKQLREHIIERSQTAEFHYRVEQERARRLPTWERILEAISELPREIQEAVQHVHVEQHTLEELAQKLGDRGLDKANSRIKQGYRSLSGRLKYPFPDAFAKVGPSAVSKRLTRREIEAAVDKMPQSNKEAFLFVHVQGHSLEELAAKEGDNGMHRAQARLDRAYVILNEQFNDVFPDAYEQAPKD